MGTRAWKALNTTLEMTDPGEAGKNPKLPGADSDTDAPWVEGSLRKPPGGSGKGKVKNPALGRLGEAELGSETRPP